MTADLGDVENLGKLTEDEAEARIHGVCFKTGPPARTGVELEWLVLDRSGPHDLISADRLDEALAPVEAPGALPRGSRLTREPGGQVELSSPPAATLAACVEAMTADLAVLRQTLGEAGLVLLGRGVDPYREPPRVLEHPRYRAMELFFDREGPWGRLMMRRTASLQINLDSGDDGPGITGYRSRWALAHRIGPVLVAAFANSPVASGRATGWLSTRQATWGRMDPGRTRHPRHHAEPRTAWTQYALDAQVLCIRTPEEPATGILGGPSPGGNGSGPPGGRTPGAGGPVPDWTAPPGLTFRDWLRGVPGLRAPTADDLDYHLSTLFPPVRPRGWLELRMTDAQDGDGWIVPTVLTATVLDDPIAADAAWAATESLCPDGEPVPSDDVWRRAARTGLADPDLAKAARALFAAADSAMTRNGTPAALRQAVSDFAERYPERGRCPADDHLDALSRA
ncbi:ergothioneine biosynthesis glutamate--cysteine ligase EgtA [Actinacidiphila acididurans]|uniref:Glutamate--cysteine ligase EgtA n=1 Tax=Actinacidiphila acididurans TaxID=2784346 RepID=A0ABS2TPC4_9ACTN|nr:ergothioneine biosynthesis glutamate--cysteine ligase EgtA [Actinacidiphila acididurans]MBM9504856.1 ergothioneine biosynthesis glutamate--cysteine ligase EgtA [Actinacidiphila acididurans]